MGHLCAGWLCQRMGVGWCQRRGTITHQCGILVRLKRETRVHTPSLFAPALSMSMGGIVAIAGRWKGIFNLLDSKTGQVIKKIECPHEAVNCAAMSHDGSFVVCGTDKKMVWVWDQTTERYTRRTHRSHHFCHFSDHFRRRLDFRDRMQGEGARMECQDQDVHCKKQSRVCGRPSHCDIPRQQKHCIFNWKLPAQSVDHGHETPAQRPTRTRAHGNR